MLSKFLCVVSTFITKKEITSFEFEAFCLLSAREKARKIYKVRLDNSLIGMKDVEYNLEVIQL
jgi:hypothetical protein